MKQLINVLWIDDNPDINSWVRKFKRAGFDLTVANSSEEGISRIKDIKQWDFIIIDGLGLDKNSSDGVSGTYNVILSIKEQKLIREVPYCILTGFIEEEDIQRLRDRLGGIRLWDKGELLKESYREDFFNYIRNEASKLEDRILLNSFEDVFNALVVLGLEQYSDDVTKYLKQIVVDNYKKELPEENTLRQIIEGICKKFVVQGFLPEEFIQKHDNVNITHSIELMTGDVAGETKDSLGFYYDGETLIPPYLIGFVKDFIQYAHLKSHVNDKSSERLYLYSTVFAICQLLVHCANLIKSNPDIQKNKDRIVDLNNYFTKLGNGLYEARIERTDDCGRTVYTVGDSIIINGKNLTDNQSVKIRKVCVNQNELSDFPLFANSVDRF